MKIVKQNEPTPNHFEDLETGDVFEFKDEYYMVLEYDVNCRINAVCLKDGYTERFEPTDTVYLKDAILTIS